ncbi:DUF3151 domain-containing protein [Pseudactinotalea sp. HY158]|uniref:DUF3151 domain-containing protein n=1 Tax=Pseudactinotalea sp. HY158 TaxID=2654547 RepID=UPI00129C99E2|nr:DUF3151 domain-containing protein [Pseudactinotalea sp. HY158]QGH70637.1 DUF3151 family protein [Pseudactinotalea sp. HY158]
MRNLLGDPDPTLLPAEEDSAARADLTAGRSAREVAAAHPAVSYPWSLLARAALAEDDVIAGYAFARTGYHRGLDALRRSGWKGHGPVPASHVPNRGFLSCLLSLEAAAAAIGEHDEAERCRIFARDCDPEAASLLA